MSDLFGPGSVTDAVRKSEFDWADWEDEPECSDTLAGPIAYDPQRYDEYPGWDAEVED